MEPQLHKGAEMLPNEIEMDNRVEHLRALANTMTEAVNDHVEAITAEHGAGDTAKNQAIADAHRLLNDGCDKLAAAIRGNR